jgi:hypothetical protein
MTWTILIILVADMRVAEVPFRDPMTCGNALPVIHNSIAGEWPDAVLQCQSTDVPLVRPRARAD